MKSVISNIFYRWFHMTIQLFLLPELFLWYEREVSFLFFLWIGNSLIVLRCRSGSFVFKKCEKTPFLYVCDVWYSLIVAMVFRVLKGSRIVIVFEVMMKSRNHEKTSSKKGLLYISLLKFECKVLKNNVGKRYIASRLYSPSQPANPKVLLLFRIVSKVLSSYSYFPIFMLSATLTLLIINNNLKMLFYFPVDHLPKLSIYIWKAINC